MRSPRRTSGAVLLAAILLGGAVVTAAGQARSNAPPGNADRPALSGAFVDGRVVSTSNGRWINSPTSFSYQWLRCDGRGDNCVEIGDAPNARYEIRSADVGRRLRSRVTACNRDGCAAATSLPGPVVSARAAPVNTAAPVLSGTAQVGQALEAQPGSWVNGVVRFDYQWERCDASGASCAAIAGAVSRSYVVGPADAGRTLRVAVTARNNRGTATAASARTVVVNAPGPADAVKLGSGETSIPVSSVSLPARLVISGVKFSPSAIRSRAQPLIGRFRVTDTRGFVVRDALVYAIGVPSNRVSFVGEQATKVDGWAAFSFRPLRGLPLVRGATLVFFVRARKAGENLLAGVSTRRLVSIRVSPR